MTCLVSRMEAPPNVEAQAVSWVFAISSSSVFVLWLDMVSDLARVVTRVRCVCAVPRRNSPTRDTTWSDAEGTVRWPRARKVRCLQTRV